MHGKLFQFAILHHGFDAKKGRAKTTIIKEPTSIVADNQKEAHIQASRAIPVKYADDTENVEIIIVGWVGMGGMQTA